MKFQITSDTIKREMADVKPEIVENYQKLYSQDPNSRVFAPLAEAYRKMGLLQEALEVAENGVKRNPQFPGGRVALAKILIDLGRTENASEQLKTVNEIEPENILALQLLADCELKLKKPKEALKAFKKLLFLNPHNTKAQKAIAKLESLTADEYEAEVFAFQPVSALSPTSELAIDTDREQNTITTDIKKIHHLKTLERMLSLADAYIVRNDHDKAIQTLNEAERQLGPDEEIVKRLKIIHQRALDTLVVPKTKADLKPLPTREADVIDQQINLLKNLLSKLRTLQPPSV